MERFQQYIQSISGVLGNQSRVGPMGEYCSGLMLPLERKSIEPMAARLGPMDVESKHQSLHHFVADSAWSDDAVLKKVFDWVSPLLFKDDDEIFWIGDDTGFKKQGKHSVGVARQYLGMLGKQDNGQVAVSISVATGCGSLPIAYQLYLPKEWAEDIPRRKKAGVPEEIQFQTKPQIALAQMRRAKENGLRTGIALFDAGYGDDTEFREGITALGMEYAVGIRPGTTAWALDRHPLPPKKYSGKGAMPKLLRRDSTHAPLNVKEIAINLSKRMYRTVEWREGTNQTLSSRFAALRVRPAHRDYYLEEMRAEEWLLIEWPKDEAEPTKYFFSTLKENVTMERLVYVTKMRWRIERDYQELKQEVGLSHFEGRGWRGFHHHATLSIAAYGFLMSERLRTNSERKKKLLPFTEPSLPGGYIPRGSPASSTPRS
jgi:SRSO17 transposase